MSKYILTFLWGTITMAFWFLAWSKLGEETMIIPNAFLVPAILSLIIAGIIACIGAREG